MLTNSRVASHKQIWMRLLPVFLLASEHEKRRKLEVILVDTDTSNMVTCYLRRITFFLPIDMNVTL
jgi:hypothetical protein